MWYAIISEDVEDSLPLRTRVRAQHLRRIEALVEEGRLLVAGPHPAVDSEDASLAGYTGSLVVADFPSLDEARKWADADPYIAGGVYRSVIVKPFKKVLP